MVTRERRAGGGDSLPGQVLRDFGKNLVERIRQPSETLGPVLGYVMRDDLVRPDPDPDAVVTWFVSQISTYPPSGPIKSAFFNLATRRFSRRLTREVFNRIWTLHAPPPWKQPGQRKKRHLR